MCRRILLALTVLLSGFVAAPVQAQFGIKFPSVGDLTKEADKYLRDQLGRSLGEQAPLLPASNHGFTVVPPDAAPRAADFHPTPLQQLADLNRPLPPGDYQFDAVFYAEQWSAHRPGRGHSYTLGRAQGRLASQISDLLFRGTVKDASPARLNAMLWRIEASVPLHNWPAEERRMVHQLTPENEKDFDADWLQKIKDKYNKTYRIATQKSFDQELATMGDIGRLTLNLEAAHQILSDQSLEARQLPDILYRKFGGFGPAQFPDDPRHPLPWMRLAGGILVRFTVRDGFLGANGVELRITPEARRAGNYLNGDPTLSEIVNGTGVDTGRCLAGYSPDATGALLAPLLKQNDGPDFGN